MREKFLIGLASVLGLLVTLFACLVCYYIWPERESTMPAWIQAIGSVAAILVSVGLMQVQLARQERNASKQVHDEQANLVLAALLYAKDAVELFAAIERGIGTSGRMQPLLLSFGAQRIAATSSNIDAIPIWKMAPSDALELARLQTGCKNLAAAFRIITDSELASRTPPPTNGGIHTIPAMGVAETARVCATDTTVAINFLLGRYKAMTGVDAPGF